MSALTSRRRNLRDMRPVALRSWAWKTPPCGLPVPTTAVSPLTAQPVVPFQPVPPRKLPDSKLSLASTSRQLGAWAQPVTGSQLSVVQALPSSQLTGGPAVQEPDTQTAVEQASGSAQSSSVK